MDVVAAEGPEYRARLARLGARAATGAAALAGAGIVAASAAIYAAARANPLALLAALLALELLFAGYCQLRRAALNRGVRQQRPPGYDGDAAFQRFVEAAPALAAYMCPRGFFSRWFFDAPFESIRRGNVEDLVAWGFHYRERACPTLAAKLGAQVDAIERAWGLAFPEGWVRGGPRAASGRSRCWAGPPRAAARDDAHACPARPRAHLPARPPARRRNPLRMMAHLWEPLPCHHRPLAWYLCAELLAAAKHGALVAAGFKHHRCGAPPGPLP
jgi:hypothetical protein